MFAVGNTINFVAFMFAAQSLLAALGSIQFVTNIFFANLINKEPVKVRAIIATVIIIVGNVFIVIFGSKGTQSHTLKELKELAFAPLFVLYLIAILAIVVVLQSIYLALCYKIRSYPTLNDAPQAIRSFLPFAYASVSAIIGTNSILLGKACAGLLKNFFRGEKIFSSVWTYAIVLAFILITIFWLYRMNTALRRYDAMFIIPVLQCVWLLFGILGGEVFFQEYKEMTWFSAIFFAFGVAILLAGITTLRPSSSSPVQESAGTGVEMEELEDVDNSTMYNNNTEKSD